MALKALILRKKIDAAQKRMDAFREKDAELQKRAEELEKAIEEAASDDDVKVVEEEADNFEAEKKEHDEAKAALETEIRDLEKELEEEERSQENTGTPAENNRAAETEEKITMNRRNRILEKMSHEERSALVAREEVKSWLGNIRTMMREKRAIQGADLTIPEVFLGLLRQNVEVYSKLYRHVTVFQVAGNGRQAIMGNVPEGIWIDCCKSLNELSLNFYDNEMDCFAVGGYFKLCNVTAEESDIDLAALLLDVIGQAIGLALDKAIVFGRNTANAMRMPLGFAARLAQESEPASYPANARPWVDLHSTHILTIANNVTGVDLFKTILLDCAVVSGKYARGEKVWIMNETTYTFLKAQAMSVNAAGSLVSAIDGTMPVIGGIVEVLDFMPNYVIAGGYLELYALAERGGNKFASSEHVRFLQDQTVYKGIGHYDGGPAIAEAFILIGVNGTSPDATAVSFPQDVANVPRAIVLSKSAATVATGSTITLKATIIPESAEDETITWASGTEAKATVDQHGKVTGVAAGSSVITATCGDAVGVCNVTVTS